MFKYPFPVSLVSPGIEWQIKPKGSNSIFIAISYINCIGFYRLIARKHVDSRIKIGKKHIKEEGENLKKILEKQNK